MRPAAPARPSTSIPWGCVQRLGGQRSRITTTCLACVLHVPRPAHSTVQRLTARTTAPVGAIVEIEWPAHCAGACGGTPGGEDPTSRRTRTAPYARVRHACVSLCYPSYHRLRTVSLHGVRYGPRRVPLRDHGGTRECGAAWLELYGFVRNRANGSTALPARCPWGACVVC
jgi:hypothetical protein